MGVRRRWLQIGGLLTVLIFLLGARAAMGARDGQPAGGTVLPPIVFVARQNLATEDTIFRDERGPAGQFGTGLAKFAPGSRLVLRAADGTLTLYYTPGLVDVQAPDISFDGSRILFAGARTLDPEDVDYGWRIYEINVDGSGFKQLTFSDRSITIPNAVDFFNEREYGTYDDLFPAYMADGRIVFNSSRYPTRSHYDSRRTFNVYVMDGDGNNLHRITTERASVLHPTPLPDGGLLVARWWNNFNQPSATGIYNRIDNHDDDYLLPDGTLVHGNAETPFNPATGLLPGGDPIRDAPNTWHLMRLNPDGSGLERLVWTAAFEWALERDDGHFDTYAAAQPAPMLVNDDLIVAFTSQPDSTMVHSTFETGIRVARPGIEMMWANAADAVAGLTYDQAWNGDESGPYALHPWGLPDGRILYSQSRSDSSLPASGTYSENGETFALQGGDQRYELYTMQLDGSGKMPVLLDLSTIGLPHAHALDAKPVVARSGWQTTLDQFTAVAGDDPLTMNVPNTLPEYSFSQQGPGDIATATIHNPNIYANPGLTTPYINNSPPPGSVAALEIWIDANQFTGASCYNNYPQPCDDFRADNQVRAVLWDTVPVAEDGAFTAAIPADVPGFFVLRGHDGSIVRRWERGYATIAQGNAWARPGETVTCVGCHMGHVSGSVVETMDLALAGETNVAPYATVRASSYHEADGNPYLPFDPTRLVDRHAWAALPAGPPGADPVFDDTTGWISALDRDVGEWVRLEWPSGMRISQVRLVGPPAVGGDWDGFGAPTQYGDYYVTAGILRLYRHGVQVGADIAVGQVFPLSAGGTAVDLPAAPVVDALSFEITATTGRWYWDQVAALAEIEVSGQAAEPFPGLTIWETFLPTTRRGAP